MAKKKPDEHSNIARDQALVRLKDLQKLLKTVIPELDKRLEISDSPMSLLVLWRDPTLTPNKPWLVAFQRYLQQMGIQTDPKHSRYFKNYFEIAPDQIPEKLPDLGKLMNFKEMQVVETVPDVQKKKRT